MPGGHSPFLHVEGNGFRKLMERVARKLRLFSADTVARREVLIDEALQQHLTLELLPLSLVHSALEDHRCPTG